MKKILLLLLSLSLITSVTLNAMAPKELLTKMCKSNLTICALLSATGYAYADKELRKVLQENSIQNPVRIAQIHAYLKKAGIKNPEKIPLIDGPWATFMGTRKIIFAPSELAKDDSGKQLETFSAAHEVGHIKHYDSESTFALTITSLYAQLRLHDHIKKQFQGASRYSKLIALWSVYLACLGPVRSAYCRTRERAADYYALTTLQDQAVCETVANRFSLLASAERLDPEDFTIFSIMYEKIFSTHPSNSQRAEYIKKYAETLRSQQHSTQK